MIRKTVSLKSIAEALNVSVSTVSRALKDHPDIGTELKNKVHNLAKKLNYTPTNFAEIIKSSSKAIGVILPSMERNFYASVVSGIESYAKKCGYFVIISNSRESYSTEVENVENLIKLGVDGLIVCLSQETRDYSHFDKVRKKDIPLVFIDRVCRTSEFSSVIADNFEAAKNITNHLITSGSKKIAHIAGPKNLSITKERIAGYKAGIDENNLIYNEEHLVYCDLTPEGAKGAVNKLLKANDLPDAIFCVNDTVAFVVMKEIRQKGYKIPEDIALTGFNNEFHSAFVMPGLTTILHPTSEMGSETARLLISQMESDHPHDPRQIVMKTKMVVRESSIKNKN